VIESVIARRLLAASSAPSLSDRSFLVATNLDAIDVWVARFDAWWTETFEQRE
jgi:hypothetical protein